MRIGLLLLLALTCCKSGNSGMKKTMDSDVKSDFKPLFIPGPAALVYKTRGNYRNLVPVLLSEDRSSIISYPHPHDLQGENGFSVPAELHKGYLLDKRGIGLNVAFLKLSYEEYFRLDSIPGPEELYRLIADKDPVSSLCNCGAKSAFSDIEKQLNQLIDRGELEKVCKKLR